MPSAVRNNLMRLFLLTPCFFLIGCAIPANDRSFVAEKTPLAAALSGEPAGDGTLEDRLRDANQKNDQRLLKGDWRAVRPAVGPRP